MVSVTFVTAKGEKVRAEVEPGQRLLEDVQYRLKVMECDFEESNTMSSNSRADSPSSEADNRS
jgi:hypothetical protein